MHYKQLIWTAADGNVATIVYLQHNEQRYLNAMAIQKTTKIIQYPDLQENIQL